MAQEEILIDSTILSTDTVQVSEEVVDEEDKQEDPFMDPAHRQVEITPRKLPSGKLEEIKSEKKFWYADSSFSKKKKSSRYGVPFFMRSWVKTLFWILVISAFAIALAWYLYNNNIRLFRKKNLPVKAAEEEGLPESIFDIDYEKELQKALAANDHRLAVRLQFLGALRSLADKGLIQYRQDRTNMDYLFQLGGKTLYSDFFRVVRHYEYSWYGQFEVSQEKYLRIESDFQKLKQQLP